MPADNTMIAAARKTLRMTTHVFDDEIVDLIDAAKADLLTAGVVLNDENEPLVRQAIKFYCRANFQNGDSKERELYDKRYQALKAQLGSCLTIYGEPADKDASESTDDNGGETP